MAPHDIGSYRPGHTYRDLKPLGVKKTTDASPFLLVVFVVGTLILFPFFVLYQRAYELWYRVHGKEVI